MKALITGGAGFIGSHLTELLLSQGHSVTALDNMVTGTPDNLAHLGGERGLTVVRDTVLNEGLMQELVPQHDQVFHLAAAVGVRWIIENPLLSIHTNIRATEVVLEIASKTGTPVLLASTSEVYGKNDRTSLREDDDSVIGSTRITRWLYANTKATDEFLSLAYHRERKLPVVIARFFNTIGPRQTGRYGMVAPTFVRQALAGEPLTVHGDGEQTRCFTDVRDAVRAIVELSTLSKAAGEVFNIGNPREISIRGLGEMIISMTGSRSAINLIPYDQAYTSGFEDMRRRVPCVDKLRSYLGWAPATPLEENLERMITHIRSHDAVPAA